MAVEKRLYTVEEFAAFTDLLENEAKRFELVNGEIIEVAPNLEHGIVAAVIHGELYAYLKRNPIGVAMFEVDHRLPGDSHNSRRPDVSFLSKARLETLARDEPVPLMPDFAVEVRSPGNTLEGQRGLRDKAAYYLRHGSRLVWIVRPDTRTVEIYTHVDEPPQVAKIGDTLDGGDVLPGFTLAAAAIFSA